MIDQTFTAKKLKNCKEILAIFSQPTRMPFVECDPETLEDQVHVFEDVAAVQEFAKAYTENKILLMASKITKEQAQSFYNTLYSIGINTVVFHDKEATYRIEIENLSNMPDREKLMQGKLPMINPSLQLSTLFFLQEICRPVEHDIEKTKELEEEMLINLVRARYILPLENAKEGEPFRPEDKEQKNRIPYVRDKEDHLLLPVFSDFNEFRKFYQGKADKMGMAVLSFHDLKNHLVPDAYGIVYNPAGFHLNMTVEQYDRLYQVPPAKTE